MASPPPTLSNNRKQAPKQSGSTTGMTRSISWQSISAKRRTPSCIPAWRPFSPCTSKPGWRPSSTCSTTVTPKGAASPTRIVKARAQWSSSLLKICLRCSRESIQPCGSTLAPPNPNSFTIGANRAQRRARELKVSNTSSQKWLNRSCPWALASLSPASKAMMVAAMLPEAMIIIKRAGKTSI